MASTPPKGSPPEKRDFRTIYRAHATMVLRTLRRLGVREADVQDAAQDVFVVVHRKLPEFQGSSTITTWVYGICLRVASDWRRRAHVQRETPTATVPERTTSGETAIRHVALRQARQRLDAALALLDEDKRSVFVLFELEQVPMKEIAETMGTPLQTAYARLYAAREQIAAHLGRPGGRRP